VRALLVAPPWRVPHLGSLALATLRPILELGGQRVDELHGATLFPLDDPSEVDVDEAYSRYLFSAALREVTDVDRFVEEALAAILRDANMNGVLYPARTVTWGMLGADYNVLRARFRRDVLRANRCLELVVERALSTTYDVVGFSLLFDDQVPAALAIARRIKAARPDTKIVLGGAACFEEQADGLLASFPLIDAVCHTEGEVVIGPLFAALVEGAPLADVPGTAWRDETGEIHHNASPALLRDLDGLPIPQYTEFLDQLRTTAWFALGPRLLFETSRGCWWGQKSLCTFCGLNAEGLAFRAKTPERAYAEIEALYERYPEAVYLQATDNILDMKYLATVFPKLAAMARDPERPLKIFYEVKSNLRADQVETLAAGGVETVQPGIESFSDEVLGLMRKGNTGLGQVQFIKFAQQAKVHPSYNIIMCNPGEEAGWYRDMIELIPSIRHLPPPTGITPMLLERFSPYFLDPDRFGIKNVRAKPSYQVLYPPGVDLARIAYLFDYDHPLFDDQELIIAYRTLTTALKDWIGAWRPDLAYYLDRGDSLLIVDRRDGGAVEWTIAGVAARLYRFLDRHTTREAIAARFPDVEPEFIDCLLMTWRHRRWLVCMKDRFLAVLPRSGPAVPSSIVVQLPARRERVSLRQVAG
jgi:ribosomal peptide maturation radical SAM protein 1